MIINKIINFFKTLINGGENNVKSHSQDAELYQNSIFYNGNKTEEIGDTFELKPDTVAENAGVGRRPVEERYPKGYKLLNEELSGEALSAFDRLAENMGMEREAAAEYIVNLCETKGGGIVEPKYMLAVTFLESSYKPNAVGDNGAAVGLGQFHEIAVREVSDISGEEYEYEDRWDTFKSLDMIAILLKSCFEKTDTLNEALGMYNQGTPEDAKSPAGKAYAEKVLKTLEDHA